MDTRSSTPEEVPPLELRKLRDLDLERPSERSRPAHLSAASGIVRRGDYAYVIGDDELDLAVFRLSSDEPGELRRAMAGELPDDPGERKREKPDLEALTALPPFEGAPHGGLLGLGSGSSPSRDRSFFWALDGHGALTGEPRAIDFKPVYERLRAELGAINIEGAAVFGECLWLFHRGNEGDAPNAVAEFALTDLSASLAGDLIVDPEELAGVRAYELGELDGVPLCFSDATALFDRLVVFTASAESEDGAIRGSVVGTIDSEGEVRRLRTIDRRWKVEGVHAAVDTAVVDFVFVCDQDDPDTPSPLLSATMPLEERFERPA
jgi:Family of unknown function (DUF6929)